MEPRTPAGKVRLEAIRTLSESGLRVSLLAAPMIPYINDHELESILEAGKEAGAISARYIFLRLPLEISDMFREWLAAHFPDRAAKVMNVIKQSRRGKDYRSVYGERMIGTGEFAKLIHSRWSVACRKLGYENEDRVELDETLFRRSNEQLELF
jgi:DNA repair photolyase